MFVLQTVSHSHTNIGSNLFILQTVSHSHTNIGSVRSVLLVISLTLTWILSYSLKSLAFFILYFDRLYY